MYYAIQKGLYVDNKREFDDVNDSIPKQNEYLDAFIPLRQRALNVILKSNATWQTFNTKVYPTLYNLANEYIYNTRDKYILLQNPFSPYIKAIPYNTRFKGRYLLETNHKLNKEIDYLKQYDHFHFLTITVNPNLYNNIYEAYKDLSKTWNGVWTSIKKRYESDNFHLYFLKTFEFQHNSYPHLHVLIGGVGKIESDWLRRLKGMNNRWFKSIYLDGYNYKGAFMYILKYIIKNTAYITSENENSTIDSLDVGNDFLKEKIISWALGMRSFSHSQHIDKYEKRLTNSVNPKIHLYYPYSTLFNPRLHESLKLEFDIHTKKKMLYIFRDISTSTHVKYFIAVGSIFLGRQRLHSKLTFKIRTFIFKHHVKTNSNSVSDLVYGSRVILDFFFDYHNYVFDFIHHLSYWDISRNKIDYLTRDLLDRDSNFARGRVKEFFERLYNDHNFAKRVAPVFYDRYLSHSPKPIGHFLKTDKPQISINAVYTYS